MTSSGTPGAVLRIAATAAVIVGEPDRLAEELANDAAVREADTLLISVPNMLGVDYNARLLENIVRHVAPAIGWLPPDERAAEPALPTG